MSPTRAGRARPPADPRVGALRSRLWAAGAAAWCVVFVVLCYLLFTPQLWYVLVIGVAGLLAVAAAVAGTEGLGRTGLLVALVVLIVAALLGGWKAGPVLLPAIVACALAISSSAANQAGEQRR